MAPRPSFLDACRSLGASGLDLLETVVDEASFGVYVDHPSLGCTYANEALLEQFGVPWDAFRGFGWASFVLPEDAERLRGAIARYEETLEPIYVTYRVDPGAGEIRWVHARVRAVVDADGRHIGSIGVTQDVTEQREFKARAVQTQKLEAVGQLSARLAHDLNNLLTVIVMAADLLSLEVSTDEGHHHMETLRRAFDDARQLTERLLTLSRRRVRPAAGTAEVDLELRRLERLLRGTLGEGITLELRLDAPGLHVPMDGASLGQVVVNLATNARDAMEGRGTLTVATSAEDGTVRLTVEDTGPGMDAATLERAFEPFFTTKEDGRGSGLGLAILRDLAELAGGRVRLESEPGRGTRATVEFPAADAAPSGDRAGPPGRGGERAGRSLLVVEDNEALRQSLAYGLAMAGHAVSAAASLAEARARLEEIGGVDVLVTDVMLPDGTGVALARELRRDRPDLPVVFTSGFAGEASGELSDLAEGSLFVPKPFRVRDILDAVDQVGRKS